MATLLPLHDEVSTMRFAMRHRLAGASTLAAWESSDIERLGVQDSQVVRLGEGEPIVILPGLAGGNQLVLPLARRLAKSHEVILIGLRGDCGFPRSPIRQSPLDHAQDVADVIAHLGLEKPAIFGVSFGGAVAIELALESPQSVGALAIFGAADHFPFQLGARIALKAVERFPLPRDNHFVNQFFNVLHGCRPDPGPLVDFIVDSCWETDQGTVASRLRGLRGYSVEDRLWRIEVPTLFMAGSRDVVVTPALQKRTSNLIAGSRFESIAGAGHVGFLTHRREVARFVTELLRRRARSLC